VNKQLIASESGADVWKRWGVITRNLSQRIIETHTLRPEWSYELAGPQELARAPESRMVRANTRYQGPRWDIELDASWTEGRVWEVVNAVWADEVRKKSASTHPEASGPTTKLDTRDEQDRLEKFVVQEGRTHVLTDVDWRAWSGSARWSSSRSRGRRIRTWR
jgi:hypothetical protein